MRQKDLTVRISKGLLGEVVEKEVNTRFLQKQHYMLVIFLVVKGLMMAADLSHFLSLCVCFLWELKIRSLV